MKKFSGAVLIVYMFFSQASAQTVVVGDNITFAPGNPWGEWGDTGNHMGTVFQDSAGIDPTSVSFYYDGVTLTEISGNLDEGSDWYVVAPGDAFGFTSLASGQLTPISPIDRGPPPWDPPAPVFVGADEFFLGVSTTGEGLITPSPPFRIVFGWVHLRNNFGQLTMIDNAVAYGSEGIHVGTTILVPEPSGIILGMLAFVSCLFFGWQRNRLSRP